jgi:CheY-like chemotaxis protein
MINRAANQRKKVLMVDDQEINLRTVGNILRAGFDISLADDGDKALALMAATPFDLLLLDIRMPTRDGFDLCQAIRAAAVVSPKNYRNSGSPGSAFVGRHETENVQGKTENPQTPAARPPNWLGQVNTRHHQQDLVT